MPPILRCQFPFPPQAPSVSMPESCSSKCPRYEAAIVKEHSRVAPDDPELLATIRSFAEWFYATGKDVEPQVRYAAELYTREDHDGTCIPKTLLFAHYKQLQLDVYGAPELSPAAGAALKGRPVASWPDGIEASGPTWAEMFHQYSRRYDDPE